jgi:hypothetical protein
MKGRGKNKRGGKAPSLKTFPLLFERKVFVDSSIYAGVRFFVADATQNDRKGLI